MTSLFKTPKQLLKPQDYYSDEWFQREKRDLFDVSWVYACNEWIRTLDTLSTYTPLAGERFRPLSHLSGDKQLSAEMHESEFKWRAGRESNPRPSGS